MNKNCIRFKDCWVSPGTQLFEALMANDMARANRIYTECEIARRLAEGEKPEHVYECLPGGVLRLLSGYDRMLRGIPGPIIKNPYAVIRTNSC